MFDYYYTITQSLKLFENQDKVICEYYYIKWENTDRHPFSIPFLYTPYVRGYFGNVEGILVMCNKEYVVILDSYCHMLHLCVGV